MDLGMGQLDGGFKCRHDVVDLVHAEVVWQGAVAGDLDMIADARDGYVVNIVNRGEALADLAEAGFEGAVVAVWVGRVGDLSGFALDVGEDGGNFGDLLEHLVLERGDEVMRVVE